MVILSVRESLQVQHPARQLQGYSKDPKTQMTKKKKKQDKMRQFWSTQKYIYIFNLPGLIYRNIIYNTVIYTFREEWISFYSLQFAICTFLSLVRSEFIFPEDQWSFYSNKYQVTQCGENLASLVLLMGEVLFITVLDCKLYVLIVLDVKCQFKMWLRD